MDAAEEGCSVEIEDAPAQIAAAAEGTPVSVKINGRAAGMKLDITPRQRDILLAGGLLNYTREHKED